jgi:hypothetical protein
MKKFVYKFFIGFLFSVFGMFAKLVFSKVSAPIEELFVSQEFWTGFLIFFLIGYVLLGNLLWMMSQKNKE